MGADRSAARTGRAGIATPPTSFVAAGWLAAGLAVVLFAACTAGSSGGQATPTVQPTAAPTPTSDQIVLAGDPAVTVENVVLACREKDVRRLQSFVAAAVSEEEVLALFALGTLERLAGRSPPVIEDGRATVAVRLEVRRGGEPETVERTWELERGADGVWRLTALPDCF